jgi:hypothetical protein
MMEAIKRLFAKPSPQELAAKELIEAEHALLVALTGRDWAEMSVDYNTKRITRLKNRAQAESAL